MVHSEMGICLLRYASTATCLVWLAAGCRREEVLPLLDVTAYPVSVRGVAEPPEAVTPGGARGVVVQRIIRAPDACRRIEGHLERHGRRVTLQIAARPTGERCRPVETFFLYTARLRGLRAGRYDLEVVHLGDGAGGDGAQMPGSATVVLEWPLEVE